MHRPWRGHLEQIAWPEPVGKEIGKGPGARSLHWAIEEWRACNSVEIRRVGEEAEEGGHVPRGERGDVRGHTGGVTRHVETGSVRKAIVADGIDETERQFSVHL